MTNIPTLIDIQLGKQSAFKTAVTQTSKLMGIEEINFTPMVESIQIKDKRSTRHPGYVSVVQKVSAAATMNGWLTYEDSPYLFDGLFATATPSQDTDAYTYAYVGAATEAAYSYWTIAQGVGSDADSIKSIVGATMQSLTIEGASGEPLTWSANLIGHSVSTDDFDSLSDRTVSLVMGDHVTLYIDPSSDAVGTTEIATTAFNFTLDVNTNRELYTHLGSLNPTNSRDARYEGSLRLGLEMNATSAAYLDSILTSTSATFEKVVRISATSTDVNGIVTVFQVDFNGVALEAPQIYQDVDGVMSYDLNLIGQYHGTLANWIKASITNGVSALP